MKRGPRDRSEAATTRARRARKDPSVAEKIVWNILRANKTGFKFRREYEVDGYRLDFYCAEARLAVELDGEQHDPARDALRDQLLAEIGIQTIRIPNTEFFMLDGADIPTNWIGIVIKTCEERTKRKAHETPPRPE